VPNPAVRARIVRLLRGECYNSDLQPLFQYARDRCDGKGAVKEVGDFTAHFDERIKGIATDATREWCITAWFKFVIWQRGLDFARLPTTFPEFLQISFRRADPRRIRNAIGVKSKKDARPVLSALINRIGANADGTLWLRQIAAEESRLLQCLSSHLMPRPAFDNDELFSGLATILAKEGDLQRSELRRFELLKPAVGLFAISVMHGCIIDIGNGSKIALNASDNTMSVGDLGVLAAAPVLVLRPEIQLPLGSFASIPGREERAIMLSTAMFTTKLAAATYCTPELIAAPKPWASSMTLEVTNDMRLGVIT
jgi:hypothetical protein